ncbi:MAG: hypothetical protein ACW98X_21970 [Promethearchaeota archaeon]|jgi:hypothetical protein
MAEIGDIVRVNDQCDFQYYQYTFSRAERIGILRKEKNYPRESFVDNFLDAIGKVGLVLDVITYKPMIPWREDIEKYRDEDYLTEKKVYKIFYENKVTFLKKEMFRVIEGKEDSKNKKSDKNQLDKYINSKKS